MVYMVTQSVRLPDPLAARLEAMAKALMKYETIDHSQIKDIMEGREPQPPEGWDDSDHPKSTGGKPKTEKEAANPIGGPASEH